MSHQQAHSDGNASSRGPLPSTDHGAVSTAAAHENQRGPGSVASIPALCNDPLPGTEEPEDNRRSKLPSGGARARSTDFDARNIGDGDRTSESPSPPMALIGADEAQASMSFSGCRLGVKHGRDTQQQRRCRVMRRRRARAGARARRRGAAGEEQVLLPHHDLSHVSTLAPELGVHVVLTHLVVAKRG